MQDDVLPEASWRKARLSALVSQREKFPNVPDRAQPRTGAPRNMGPRYSAGYIQRALG